MMKMEIKDQGAVPLDDTRGALWLPSYLRRDATALSLLLLSMSITSSFLRMAIDCDPPGSDGSMAQIKSDVNSTN